MAWTLGLRRLLAGSVLIGCAGCNAIFGIELGEAWPPDSGAGEAGGGGARLDASSGLDMSSTVDQGGATGDVRPDSSNPQDSTGGQPDRSLTDTTTEQDSTSRAKDSAADTPETTGGEDNTSADGSSSEGGFDVARPDTGPTNCVTAMDCAGFPHVRVNAPVSCMQGRCIVPDSSCDPGWGHCTNNDLEFCETDLTTSARCGTCTTVCSETSPLCTAGACTARCTGTTPDECPGSCVNKNTDLQNCGTCGNVCVYPNADPICSGGQCSMGNCRTGYGNCTTAAGCETRLNSLSDCGQCNTPCGAPGDIASCATGSCVITCTAAPENCFNNQDDDCDNMADCGDPDCAAVATCEAVPAGMTYGTSVTLANTCPSGFGGGELLLHGSLIAGAGCSGCGCTPTTTTCTPGRFNVFQALPDCEGQLPTAFGTEFNDVLGGFCVAAFEGSFTGYQVTSTLTQNCSTSGTASPATPTWGTDTKFCTAAPVGGGGCTAGNVCVPRPAPLATACMVATGAVSCPNGFAGQTLYTGFSDNRTCDCSCTASGGNCSRVLIGISNTAACSRTYLAPIDSGYHCGIPLQGRINYSFEGLPTNPNACSTSYNQQGTVTPSGPRTLCCR